MAGIYFTSDTHFNHQGILQYRKQFATVEEMNELIISNWNRTVTNEDEVYFLGDFQMSKSANLANSFLRRLNGKIHLVRGNHDYWHTKKDFDHSLLESISDYKELKYNKRRICLMHYDINFWKDRDFGSIHLHGHLHSSNVQNIHNYYARVFKWDVGVDGNDFCPVSIDYIMSKFSGEAALEDRHGNMSHS